MEDDLAFSSFAHLIGLLRGLDRILTGKSAAADNSVFELSDHSDTFLVGWLSLLPQCKREAVAQNGSVDLLLLEALLLMYT